MRALAAILLLSLAPPALAQQQIASPSCDLLKKLAEDAPSGFTDYRGGAIDKTRYASNLAVPGYTCAVQVGPPSYLFMCFSAPMVAGAASARYDADLERIRACFPGWSERPPAPTDNENIRTEKGVRLTQDFAGGELAIGLFIGRVGQGRSVEHRLGFGVSWAMPAQ